jgi:hypothetical protein
MKKYHSIKNCLFLCLLFVSLANIAFCQTKEEIAVKIKEVDAKMREIERVSEQLANDQLTAWNNKDIKKFIESYSDSVRVLAYPNTLTYVGKQKLREKYQRFFKEGPQLRCEIVKRIVFGNKIIDYERITGYKDNWVNEAVAIYTIANNKISEVCFLNKSF